MKFSDTTNKNGILQKCEFYVFGSNYGQITDNPTRLAEFTSLCNDALDNVTSVLLNSDNTWQWDDTNYDDFPVATTDLVNGQADYSLEKSHLKIEHVEALDNTGTYYPLYPIDTSDIFRKGISPTDYFTEDSMPRYYDKIGNSIVLYPAADLTQVTETNGLQVRFQRQAEYFETTDTTKEPGFASIHHRLIPLYASFEYASSNEMSNKITLLSGKIDKEEARLESLMGKRNADVRPIISMRIKKSK